MKKLSILLVLLVVFFLVSCSSEKDEVEHETKSSVFTKQIKVFGVHVYATAGVADEKMLHAANMLAEYLDNDEDGIPDNQLVVDALVRHNTALMEALNAVYLMPRSKKSSIQSPMWVIAMSIRKFSG